MDPPIAHVDCENVHEEFQRRLDEQEDQGAHCRPTQRGVLGKIFKELSVNIFVFFATLIKYFAWINICFAFEGSDCGPKVALLKNITKEVKMLKKSPKYLPKLNFLLSFRVTDEKYIY